MKLHRINGYDACVALNNVLYRKGVPAYAEAILADLARDGFYLGVPNRDMIPASEDVSDSSRSNHGDHHREG